MSTREPRVRPLHLVSVEELAARQREVRWDFVPAEEMPAARPSSGKTMMHTEHLGRTGSGKTNPFWGPGTFEAGTHAVVLRLRPQPEPPEAA